MQPTRSKQVIWDPRGSSRFVVGGGAELRMYEWERSKPNSKDASDRFTTIAVVSELSQLRTFAWSPHPNLPDLLAVGLSTGKTLLLRLDSSTSPSAIKQAEQGITPRLSAVALNVRHSRPCNSVAFCLEKPGLVAIGLEKARGESLLVFDIEASANSLEGSRNGYSNNTQAETPSLGLLRQPPFLRNSSPAASATNPAEPLPIIQFGSSESVTSAAFLASGGASAGPVLVGGMGGKWLRAYDLRSPSASTPAAQWGTRAVFSISPNPFNGHQFASHGDDGIIKLWDMRKSTDALLSFSEVDAGAVMARSRPTIVAKPLAEMAWSPGRRGMFTTLEKEGHTLRVWNLVDGPAAVVTRTTETPGAFHQGARPSQPPTPAPEETLRMPVLLNDRRPQPFHLPLTSFAFAHSPSDPSSIHFIGVSRDTANPGSSGHQMSIVDLPDTQYCGFASGGLVAPNEADPTGFRTFALKASTIDHQTSEDLVSPGMDIGSPEGLSPKLEERVRGRSLSLSSVYLSVNDMSGRLGGIGSEKGRVEGSLTPRRLSRIR
ncbi:hypothetical protein P7C70_g4990, partial [Phenoliferia sp. Uapishka_3]